MAMPILSEDQKKRLKEHGKEFVGWLKTEDGIANIKEHREHERYFKEKLSMQNIERLTEADFSEIWKALWASRICGNKE